jgi:hypothetical protein
MGRGTWDDFEAKQTTSLRHRTVKKSRESPRSGPTFQVGYEKLKDRITPHVTNFFRLRLSIEKQEGKRKYKSDGAVMVGEFVCMYVCSCTVSEGECE